MALASSCPPDDLTLKERIANLVVRSKLATWSPVTIEGWLTWVEMAIDPQIVLRVWHVELTKGTESYDYPR